MQTEIEATLTAYAEWRHTLTQLEPAESDAFAGQYTQWLEDSATAALNPLKQTIQAANTVSQNRISQQKAQAEADQKEVKKQLAEKTTELDRLHDGHQEPPPSPHYRDEVDRKTRSGAPLWKLIDFHESLNTAQRAGIEAALESSTLLDAWVTPEGDLLDSKNAGQLL